MKKASKKSEQNNQKSKDSKKEGIFDTLFGEFGELIQFVIGMFVFMAVMFIGIGLGPVLFMKVMDYLRPPSKTKQIEPIVSDSSSIINSISKKIDEIDSLHKQLKRESENQKKLLKEKIVGTKRIADANNLIDSLSKEYGVSEKSSKDSRLFSRTNYVNWIIGLIVTFFCGLFFYRLGKRAERKKP